MLSCVFCSRLLKEVMPRETLQTARRKRSGAQWLMRSGVQSPDSPAVLVQWVLCAMALCRLWLTLVLQCVWLQCRPLDTATL
jgi:hypothetical protein